MDEAWIPWIRAVGVLQGLVAAMNLALPGRLDCRRNLARVDPLIRQIFVVHWVYIVIVLLGMAAVCLLFPGELASGHGLGRFLSAGMSLFWLGRAGVQIFYYDPEVRRRHRVADGMFLAGAAFMGSVMGAAAGVR